MAQDFEDAPTGVSLLRLSAGGGLEAHAPGRPLPPVESWRPPFCGDIGLRIARDGSWSQHGAPILRPALVRLFSTILRRDGERYLLVTPVESVSVEVEDAPFVAVAMRVLDEDGAPAIEFTTNVGDRARAGPDHPIRFEKDARGGLKPYVLVRGALEALVARALVPELVALAETRRADGEESFGVFSDGAFFKIASAAEVAAIEAAD